MTTRGTAGGIVERMARQPGMGWILGRWQTWTAEHSERGCGDVTEGCRCECEDHRCIERYVPTYKCDSCRDTGYVRYARKLHAAGFGRAEPCPTCRSDKDLAAGRFRRLVRGTFRPEDVQAHTLRQYPKAAASLAARAWYANCREGGPAWLVLWGPAGTGKTHTALSLGNLAASEGRRVYVCTAAEWLETLRQSFDQRDNEHGTPDPRRSARGSDLLVIDDLGKEHTTRWGYSELFTILDGRWREGLPTVITMNLPGGLQSVDRSDPLWSRVLGRDTEIVYVGGVDHRQAVQA